ncbi:G-type lectin S-receptor-like serine/threonine-protein kinase At4g27290 isoform X2 [Spinacia oleracea]|uniref:Receptor-like serine/threonine-protein kinase n=1 Tax=Spinacia oleracea TaxID=3562 RepID=A0ABM3RTZ9_SPIOL|nr:G-type lectin S-receptor-like serine/threonine-protein kinase At4g27290 isoform X2 [Spinacia oleracea]
MKATYSHVLLWLLLSVVTTCGGRDTISVTQSVGEGESLVSSGGDFELGFFTLGSDGRKYIGIWFKKVQGRNVVWVANRERPLVNSFGDLQLTNTSLLVLVNSTGSVMWSTNSSRSVQSPIAQLLDSGNLVVRDENDNNPDNYLWQSFDYPCDSQLPGMKLGRNFVTGVDRYLTSWKSYDDPSPGSYTYRFNPQGYPQPILYRDSVEQYRDGPWNGFWFSGNSLLNPNPSELYQFVFNQRELYYVYELINFSLVTNRFLNTLGSLQRVEWNNRKQGWDTYLSKPTDSCDMYALCGSYGICNNVNFPRCQCVKGFVPKSPIDWNDGVCSDGCVLSTPFNCSINNGFIKYSNVKLPDTRSSWYNTTMTLEECKNKCLKKCSCVAYANLDVTDGGTGCLLWFDNLIDVRVLSGVGQDLYVRVSSSGSGGDGKIRIWVAVGSSLLLIVILSCVVIFIRWRKWRPNIVEKYFASRGGSGINKNKKEEKELPIYPFNVITRATNYFSLSNKVGEGGFGCVYKGVLNDGQEIAVKRLSKNSKQGLDEFKNEALFIAKLQHRNLVRLIGCCVKAEEQILIYEYMPNNSLDRVLFDKTSSGLLDWPKRFEIINGIARGLLYLHQDSRLRIVHRDLKASNVLLDKEMNPKISDFGMARSFTESEDEAKTKRVVGTYGYMPPEYTIDGLFSVKSDVYSFGVIVLEIVCGKKNRGFNHPDHHHSLLGHAWMHFKDGATLDIVDESILKMSYASEIQRSIQIGLLCVQQNPEDRPSMSQVSVMLSGDTELAIPTEPGFFVQRYMPQESHSGATQSSSNEVTVTLLSGR